MAPSKGIIPFNKPYAGEAAVSAVNRVLQGQTFAGGGPFTQRCKDYFSERFGFEHTFLTSSCTDALEMCALLLDLKEGDEIIVPSYTYVTSALAFRRQGANIIFADSQARHPNINIQTLDKLISPKTKAIVAVHYAGMGSNLYQLKELCTTHNLVLIEDAAQAIDAYFDNKPLGSFGQLACMSFHETKNIHCGEGGMLIVNDDKFTGRAQILLDKGTNRSDFRRGLVKKYECVDIGSSFLASELQAAFLYGQLEHLDAIQSTRLNIWNRYNDAFQDLPTGWIPFVPELSRHNAHCFYLTLPSEYTWSDLTQFLKKRNISSVTHYQALHKSPFFKNTYQGEDLCHADYFTNSLVRLPLFAELTLEQQLRIIESVFEFERQVSI
ncbi:MAG: dTDP-4-amino-4,6-dideoxygalactose transaminase [Bacteroidota bacterium]